MAPISRRDETLAGALAARVARRLAAAGLALALGLASPAFAACSLVADPTNAGARMLQCGAATAHLAKGSLARPAGGAALRLQRGALLVEFQPQPGAQEFQIETPEAVAAVRGTTWAVEVERGKTSVFVVDGRVEVRASGSGATVALFPGEGVDVVAGATTLETKRWPEPRVRKLLSRFGR